MAKDESPLFADYRLATVRIHIVLSNPEAKASIEQICKREQECLELWLENGDDDKERLSRSSTGRWRASVFYTNTITKAVTTFVLAAVPQPTARLAGSGFGT